MTVKIWTKMPQVWENDIPKCPPKNLYSTHACLQDVRSCPTINYAMTQFKSVSGQGDWCLPGPSGMQCESGGHTVVMDTECRYTKQFWLLTWTIRSIMSCVLI